MLLPMRVCAFYSRGSALGLVWGQCVRPPGVEASTLCPVPEQKNGEEATGPKATQSVRDGSSGNRERVVWPMDHGQSPSPGLKYPGVPPRQRPHPQLKKLGQFVRETRESKSLTQEDVAEKAGFDRTYMSNLERGRRNPSLLHLKKLAKALGVRPSEFFDVIR